MHTIDVDADRIPVVSLLLVARFMTVVIGGSVLVGSGWIGFDLVGLCSVFSCLVVSRCTPSMSMLTGPPVVRYNRLVHGCSVRCWVGLRCCLSSANAIP